MGRKHKERDKTMTRAHTESNSARHLPPAVEQQINENLRMLYEQQLQQELPDQLKTLIERLRSEANGK